jgi:hypothetical protein
MYLCSPDLAIFLSFAFMYLGQHLPREVLGWYMCTCQLGTKAQSFPPTYSFATAGYYIDLGSRLAQQA